VPSVGVPGLVDGTVADPQTIAATMTNGLISRGPVAPSGVGSVRCALMRLLSG
jgi:hypothetical protein